MQSPINIKDTGSQSGPRVRYARYVLVDSEEEISLYHYSHEDIDADIDERNRLWPDGAIKQEATRSKMHAAFDAARSLSRTCMESTPARRHRTIKKNEGARASRDKIKKPASIGA